MIVLKISRNKTRKYYTVYENYDEFLKAGCNLELPINAKEGDYVQTDNGYYIPVIKRTDYPPKGTKLYWSYKLSVPYQDIFGYDYKDPNRINPYKPIMFKRERKQQITRKLNAKAVFIGNLLLQGIPLEAVYALAYSKKDKFSKYNFKRLLGDPVFANYIKDVYMNEIKQALLDNGITYDAIAKEIKTSLQKSNVTLNEKKWAIDLAVKLLDNCKQDVPIPQLPQSPYGVSSEGLTLSQSGFPVASETEFEIVDITDNVTIVANEKK